MPTTSPEPARPAPGGSDEAKEPRHRVLGGEAQVWPHRSAPDPSRGGVEPDEVPSALHWHGHATEVVRPVSAEAAAHWDAALWHHGARR